MKDYAVYARQSVEKKNSLSIEGQIDLCRRAAGHEMRVYQDRGFSGRNTNRPDFQRLMADIRADRIDKLYVYRLDRFSRSVADFGRLWEILQEHHVEFVSVSESFDTSAPMGRAMLHIIMVFAQLERETTAERVRDNYYKRAGLGAWPGGPAPYGFTLGRRRDAAGRSVSALTIVREQAAVVERVFRTYAAPGESLGSVARMLNRDGVAGPKRSAWDSAALSRMLHCPVYVRANEDVLLYYQSLGAVVTADEAAFDGRHELLVVGKRDKAKRRYTDVHAHQVSVLASEGFIAPEVWLACQYKLARNQQLGNRGKGTHTWLSGLLKCAECGYSLKVTETASGRYLHCSGRYNLARCTARIRLDLNTLENEAASVIQSLLDECPSPPMADGSTVEFDGRLRALDHRADRLLAAFSESSTLTAAYLERALQRIETERCQLLEAQRRQRQRPSCAEAIRFDALSFDEKKLVASRFLQSVRVGAEETEIHWKL